MKICLDKNTKIDNIILAPMSGVTDMPFRNLVKSWHATANTDRKNSGAETWLEGV